jgi:hypothetical protein
VDSVEGDDLAPWVTHAVERANRLLQIAAQRLHDVGHDLALGVIGVVFLRVYEGWLDRQTPGSAEDEAREAAAE